MLEVSIRELLAQEAKDREKSVKVPQAEAEKPTLRSDSKLKGKSITARHVANANVSMHGDCDDQELSDTQE